MTKHCLNLSKTGFRIPQVHHTDIQGRILCRCPISNSHGKSVNLTINLARNILHFSHCFLYNCKCKEFQSQVSSGQMALVDRNCNSVGSGSPIKTASFIVYVDDKLLSLSVCCVYVIDVRMSEPCYLTLASSLYMFSRLNSKFQKQHDTFKIHFYSSHQCGFVV